MVSREARAELSKRTFQGNGVSGYCRPGLREDVWACQSGSHQACLARPGPQADPQRLSQEVNMAGGGGQPSARGPRVGTGTPRPV